MLTSAKRSSVSARKQGTQVLHALAAPEVADLLAPARHILSDVLTDQVAVLEDLRTSS